MVADLRTVLDDHWARLDEDAVTSPDRIRTSELPVSASMGPLLAAVDPEGHRHILVPLRAGQHVRRGRSGSTLVLRERPLMSDDIYERYADLSCMRRDLDDIFTGLCADVLTTVAEQPDRPIRAVHTVLERWHSLFEHAPVLGPEQLEGLFGELLILNKLLDLDAAATEFWTGPAGHRHDFAIGLHAIEVKTTTLTEGRRIRVHGVDQLQTPFDGTLDLVWLRLERVGSVGLSVVDLVETARQATDDQTELARRLAQAGYRSADADTYQDTRFSTSEEIWFEVNDLFPRLDPDHVPAEIRDVHYTVELATARPLALDGTMLRERLMKMVGNTA